MAWGRIDDQFYMNPKTALMDRDEQDLYIAGNVYCNGQLTDGAIPASMLMMLCAWAKIPLEANAQANAQAIASRLVEHKFWDVTPIGYQVHDYLDWNMSREEVLELKAARSEAGKLGGQRSAATRQAKAQASASASAQAKPKQKRTQSLSQYQGNNGCAPDGAPSSEHQLWFGAICEVIGADPKTLSQATCKEITDCKDALLRGNYTRDELARWFTDIWSKEFPGKTGERPTIKNIRDKIGKVRAKAPVKVSDIAAEIF